MEDIWGLKFRWELNKGRWGKRANLDLLNDQSIPIPESNYTVINQGYWYDNGKFLDTDLWIDMPI